MRTLLHQLLPVLLVLQLSVGAAIAQTPNTPAIVAGPMIGDVNMREAKLWVMLDQPTSVQYRYTDATTGNIISSETVNTQSVVAGHHYATVTVNTLLPSREYDLTLYTNGIKATIAPIRVQTPPDWVFRSQPPAFRIALGSCAFTNDAPFDRPGGPYGGGYEIYNRIVDAKPDLMLWLGDNLYLRTSDINSRTGIFYRYGQSRSLPEMQPLLRACPNYAIWDDHDYGANNSDRGYLLKDHALDAFSAFWPNPTVGTAEFKGAVSMFNYGDVDVYLLDNRYHRSPNNRTTGARQILGDEQLQWLIDNMKSSYAKFKLVCIGGQVLNPVAKFETHQNVAPGERRALLKLIQEENIKGVVFLTGDRHHSELSVLKEDNQPTIYDFTVSPLTAGAHDASDEANDLRVQGSHVGERNFGTIDVTGKSDSRKLTLTLWDAAGKQLWQHAIDEDEWQK